MTDANELGDNKYDDGDTIPLPSDGTGNEGDFVTYDVNGQVTPVAAAGDEIVGVLAQDSPANAGEDVGVHVQGVVVANVAGTVSAFEWLEPDGVNAGRATANAEGASLTVDEGGTAVHNLRLAAPRALEDGDADTYAAKVRLP